MTRKRKEEKVNDGSGKRAGWCYGVHYSDEAEECAVCELRHTCRENTKLLEETIDKESKNDGANTNGKQG